MLMLASGTNLLIRFGGCLEYCYHLCKKYIQRYGALISANTVFDFMCTLAGCLVRYLMKAKFYEQLRALGGWVSYLDCYVLNDIDL